MGPSMVRQPSSRFVSSAQTISSSEHSQIVPRFAQRFGRNSSPVGSRAILLATLFGILLFAVFGAAPACGAAQGITRNAHGVVDTGGEAYTSSPFAVPLTNVAAGDLIVCEVSLESVVTLVSVSDPENGTYAPALAMHTNSALTQQMGVYYVANAVAGSYSVSVAWTGGTQIYQAMACQSWTGAASASPQDATLTEQQDVSSASNATTGSALTPATAGELVIGILSTDTQTPTAGSNYTLTDSATSTRFWPEFWVQSSATATNAPYVNAADLWTDQMVAFKAASASVPVAPKITSASSASGAVGSAFSYQIAASGSPTSYAASGLPAGLTVSSATGLISGTPTAAGTSTVTLSATNSAGTGTGSLALTIAAAAQATLSINATSLSFGDVYLNSPATQSVTLTSSGTAAVTVSAATISGAGFSDSGATFPLTLTPNQTATLAVEFDPTAAGAVTGSLTIASNSSSNGTAVVSLSGTGETDEAWEVNVTWSAPTSSPDPVAGYNVYRSSNGGTSYQQLNAASITTTTYSDTTVQTGVAYDYIVESVDANGLTSSPSNTASVTCN